MSDVVTKGHREFWKRKSSWLVIPLALFTLVNLYYAAGILPLFLNPGYFFSSPNHLSSILLSPSFCTLIVGIFGLLYIYKAIRGIPHVAARVVAWIYVALAIVGVSYVLLGTGRVCSGFFGVSTSCVDTHFLTIFVLYFNPVAMVIWDTLALAGGIALFLKQRGK